MKWGANVGKGGIYDFLSQFGYAESKNGGYQKYFARLGLLICIKMAAKIINLGLIVSRMHILSPNLTF